MRSSSNRTRRRDVAHFLLVLLLFHSSTSKLSLFAAQSIWFNHFEMKWMVIWDGLNKIDMRSNLEGVGSEKSATPFCRISAELRRAALAFPSPVAFHSASPSLLNRWVVGSAFPTNFLPLVVSVTFCDSLVHSVTILSFTSTYCHLARLSSYLNNQVRRTVCREGRLRVHTWRSTSPSARRAFLFIVSVLHNRSRNH